MKRNHFLFTALFAVVLFFAANAIFGQNVDLNANPFGDRAYLMQVPSFNLDSTATEYSAWFQLTGWDAMNDYKTVSGQTYTPVPFYGTYQLASSAGKPRVTWIIQGTNDPDDTNDLTTIATICTADSVETLQASTISLATKRAWYRHKITGTAGNREDTYIKGQWYLPKKREK